MNSISITYTIKFELDFASNYKWLNNNQCYNIKSGRIIKQVLCGGSIGYIINGKFKSLFHLKKCLQKPSKNILPF